VLERWRLARQVWQLRVMMSMKNSPAKRRTIIGNNFLLMVQ
jgi:hypothetical protein